MAELTARWNPQHMCMLTNDLDSLSRKTVLGGRYILWEIKNLKQYKFR